MVKEISLVKLVKAIWSKLWLVIALTLLFGTVANIYTTATTTPMYSSEALLYIYNNDKGNTSGQMSQTNMLASEQVLYRYVVLIDKADIIYEIAMEKLRERDAVAYVRFASVYRQFKDINTFMSELKKLLIEE